MKPLILLGALLFTFTAATAQPSDAARQSFDAIVANFRTFFSTRQLLAYKQNSSESPTKELSYIVRYMPDSDLTSQFPQSDPNGDTLKATITIAFFRITNKSCGNVESLNEGIGWDSLASAIAEARDADCYELARNEVHGADPVEFAFAYENDRWVLKSATRTRYGRPDLPITSAMIAPIEMAIAITEPEGLEFNKPWRDLVTR
jgi:hypothetical protein